jgi:hypothetical protein
MSTFGYSEEIGVSTVEKHLDPMKCVEERQQFCSTKMPVGSLA